MTWLALILFRRGMSERMAGVLSWVIPALIVVLLVLLVWFEAARWLANEKHAAVMDDRKDVTIEAANRVIAAERAATANETANAAMFANSQEELHDDVLKNGTAAPVGLGVSSVLDRMRTQQRTGRR